VEASHPRLPLLHLPASAPSPQLFFLRLLLRLPPKRRRRRRRGGGRQCPRHRGHRGPPFRQVPERRRRRIGRRRRARQ
jgi:hypothetical protein